MKPSFQLKRKRQQTWVGSNTRDLYTELFGEIFVGLADVRLPAAFEPPLVSPNVDHSLFLGTYESGSRRLEFFIEDDKPVFRSTLKGPLAEVLPATETFAIVPFSDGVYAIKDEGAETWIPVLFYVLPSGERYVHLGGRATARNDDPADAPETARPV